MTWPNIPIERDCDAFCDASSELTAKMFSMSAPQEVNDLLKQKAWVGAGTRSWCGAI